VQFKDGSADLGAAVQVTSGSATLPETFALGTHPLTAVFTPAGSTAFDPSKSDTLSYTVSAPTTTPLPPTPPAFRFSPTSLSQLIPWLLGQLHLPTF